MVFRQNPIRGSMEYCRGGDLTFVIKKAQKHNCLIPEETVWHYFTQILPALDYCHRPKANPRSGGSAAEGEHLFSTGT
jgi:serine/threonine protein kinase